jgi:hypothetical protein
MFEVDSFTGLHVRIARVTHALSGDRIRGGLPMHTVPGRCPVCGEDLTVRRLQCRSCDTSLEGHFGLGRFYKLDQDQLQFVETFIRCEGKLNRAQEELGMSYPTVRSRLHDAIRALGYEVDEVPTMSPQERKSVLDQLAEGKISSEEAVQLLQGD